MKIKVVNQRLYLEPPETAEGTREYLRAEFSFSEEWKGMTKTAFFRGANGNTYSQLLENDACTVPAEALAVPGRVGVSVSGTLGETVITTDIKSFTVPATLSGGTPSDPEPTVWQQILNKVNETQQIAQSVREDAEAGKFAATAEMVERAVSTYMTGLSPEMHRNTFRGKCLGESITEEQLTAIQDGRFYDLYVGDYWEINEVKYRIADINYWRNVGYPEQVQKPHILIVPDTFKNILISHRMFSDGTWINASVDLMNEVMVHGTYICTDHSNKQTSDTQQLALFRHVPELKTIGANYWLRNLSSAQTYTLVSQYGDASSDMATSTYGIRPVFAIG